MLTRVVIAACLLASAVAWVPLMPKPVRSSSTALSATAEGVRRKDIVKTLKTATKENFYQVVYDNAALEEQVRKMGSPAYPKMRKRITKRATELGVTPLATFAQKKYSGPPLWLKGKACDEIKAAMEKRDVEAIQAAIDATAEVEGVTWENKEGERYPLLVEAEALIETINNEADAAAAEAPAEDEAPAE